MSTTENTTTENTTTTEATTTKDPIPAYIAGYARVSSVGQNTGRQLDGIEDYIRERWGEAGVKRAYDTGGIHEEKASGKTAKNRPILQEVISKLRKRDVLIVHSPDRLARSSRDWHNITAELTDKGVHVVYVKYPNLDTTTPMGKLILSILADVSEIERAFIAERRDEGIKRARAEGRIKPRALTLAQVEEAREKVEAGVSKAKVARDLGVSRATLYRYLEGITPPRDVDPENWVDGKLVETRS